jgi:predicted RNase H-like nuclease
MIKEEGASRSIEGDPEFMYSKINTVKLGQMQRISENVNNRETMVNKEYIVLYKRQKTE